MYKCVSLQGVKKTGPPIITKGPPHLTAFFFHAFFPDHPQLLKHLTHLQIKVITGKTRVQASTGRKDRPLLFWSQGLLVTFLGPGDSNATTLQEASWWALANHTKREPRSEA